MNTVTLPIKSDKSIVIPAVLGLLALAVFLQIEFNTRLASLYLIGVGMGIALFHAAFGFTGGWRNFIRERRSAGIRAQLVLLGLTSILFFPILGDVWPGINSNGASAPVGLSVLIGAFLFGIGMQLGGGCGSGTLFTVGGGHVRMLVTLAFFIVGATLGSAHLHWWLALPSAGNISLIKNFGWIVSLLLQLSVFAALFFAVRHLELKQHGNIEPLHPAPSRSNFAQQFIYGPWPLWWGAIALSILGLLTLLIAGHPWSITFAFGLWGAKIWAALGGDVISWPYWSSGYPARALNQSVLADITSIMNFGIILGALLASSLAGQFAPQDKIPALSIIAAIIGGFLLGYGARLAFGCNIGALLAGIGSGSLHGWLWLVAGFSGAILGTRLRIMFQLDPVATQTTGQTL